MHEKYGNTSVYLTPDIQFALVESVMRLPVYGIYMSLSLCASKYINHV